MPSNTLCASFKCLVSCLSIQPTTNAERIIQSQVLFQLWTDDGVSGFVIIKIVDYQHLVLFEDLLSLRLSDPFALVVG